MLWRLIILWLALPGIQIAKIHSGPNTAKVISHYQACVMIDVDFESLSLEELTHILKEVSRIVDKRVKSEIGQHRLYAQKFAESVGLEVKGTRQNLKEKKGGSEKRTSIYKHPEDDSLVWEGTGRKPKWLTELLKSGRNLDDFRVAEASVREKPEGVEVKPGVGEVKDEKKEAKTEWQL
jgi:DNA-binding protein H-NS